MNPGPSLDAWKPWEATVDFDLIGAYTIANLRAFAGLEEQRRPC
jgi:hypothetical protein